MEHIGVCSQGVVAGCRARLWTHRKLLCAHAEVPATIPTQEMRQTFRSTQSVSSVEYTQTTGISIRHL